MDELFSSPELSEFPLSLHLAMIQDRVRMDAYDAAMRAVIRPGDTVVDVGTGTGVLAILASRCGAREVIGLERSMVVDYARRLVELNCPDAPIRCLRADVRTDDLSGLRADILVCELMGNFGIDEDMVHLLATAREKLLEPHGRTIPASLDLIVAPVQCTRAYREVASWRRRERGIDFSPLQPLAYNAVYQITSEPVRLLAPPAVLLHVDFGSVTRLAPSACARFDIEHDGTLHGIAGWFRSTLAPGHVLDTGPDQTPTHWGQVLFPIGDPVRARAGASVGFEFSERSVDGRVRWRWEGTIRPSPRSGKSSTYRFEAARDLREHPPG